MKIGDFAISNQTRLFIAGKKVGDEKFIYGVLPWRIMWNGGNQRVILKEYIGHTENWLKNFPDGCTLDLLGGVWGMDKNDSRYEGVWLYRFVGCELRRAWIPDAGAMTMDEKSQLYFYAEIDCVEILEMMIDYEGK